MKKVRINVGKIGVVTKKGDYKKVLTAGTYWLGFSEMVKTFDMSKMYTSDIDLTIMLKDEKFKDLVEILEEWLFLELMIKQKSWKTSLLKMLNMDTLL